MPSTPIAKLMNGMIKPTRNAVVADQFYPGEEQQLRQQITHCFLDDRGVGRIPQIISSKQTIKALIVPHAGYVYSGAIASHAYARLAESGFADTFIIIGPNHTGMGSGVSVMTTGAWKTPLGTIPIDEPIAKALNTGIIDQDISAHSYEHSIEVQLPFLQYIAQDTPFTFVPICMMMQDYQTAQDVGTILADVIQNSKKNIILIASTDFSHAGFNYRSMPPKDIRVDCYAEQQDTKAIKKITALDPAGLIQTVEKYNITMCGSGPVAAVLTAVKQKNATKAELLKYGTSYEVHPNSSCVGYAAIAIT